tara:strand:- start:454 stop:1242 length:789 start_codon:yes stop_codon:yes gene_type:complete
MWTTIVAGVVVLNIMLFIIHYSGPKAITLTWVPGRVIVIVISMLHQKELHNWLQITWAAYMIPVSLLAIFHFTLRYMANKGRLPRFSCATPQWLICWSLGILSMTTAAILCIVIENPYILFSIGILAAYLNIVNVMDAPTHLHETPIKFTTWYIIGTNIVIVVALVLIDQLIQHDYVRLAGVISNIPILSIVLLAGSSCADTEEAVNTTNQHIYMLAYQTWPAMAFVGVMWIGQVYTTTISLTMSISAVVVVLFIQFIMAKT